MNRNLQFCAVVVASVLALVTSLNGATGSTFKVLYSFTGGNDGCYPTWNLVVDSKGNLYGTTPSTLCGLTIFRIAPDGTHSVLAYDAGEPGPLVLDQNENLWGTTCCGGNGYGTIFEIPRGGKEREVYNFKGSPRDGCDPSGAMIAKTAGGFFGTTSSCGKRNFGSIFELARDGTESLVYSFKGGRDGYDPFAGPIMDASGNLFGTNVGGGRKGAGTIFKIASGGTETLLYAFKGSPKDGSVPDGTLILDPAGNIYGTLRDGGMAGCDANEGCGAVFELTPSGTETILHFFAGGKDDGSNPIAGVVANSAGSLLGTTLYGGGTCALEQAYGCGMVYELAPDGKETILYNFSRKNGANGAFPTAGLTMDSSGNLYGTTEAGGAYGYGTVFKIMP